MAATTPDAFAAAMAFTMKEEGGYSADRGDTGNWLKYQFIGSCHGVTAAALLRCVGAEHLPPLTAGYMRTLPDAETSAVYRSYWQAMGCDRLPPGIGLSCFDAGFNTGERTSIKLLQQCLGFPIKGDPGTDVDGKCGPATQRRAGLAEPRELVHGLYDAQVLYCGGLAQFGRYGHGWLERTARRRDAALAMLARQNASGVCG